MSTHHCEECWAILDPTKILRCTKCKACRYCSRECQKKNWKLHKRVCTSDQSLRPFIPVEMAIERALAKMPPMEQAPKGATCYICLEGEEDGKSSKLMRACACRGDSAGFVHLECLAELAVTKEDSDDIDAVFNGWNECPNCKQDFQGALELEMSRRFWRRHRSSQDVDLRYESSRSLACSIGVNSELDAANQLLDEASTCVDGNDKEVLLQLNCIRVNNLNAVDQNLEALGLLQVMLPEAKECTDTDPRLYSHTLKLLAMVLLDLDRYQEAHEAATETVAFNKANYGPEDSKTLSAMTVYAAACAKLGLVEEAKAKFEDVLTTQTRVLGPNHPVTQGTLAEMRTYGCAEPSG